MRVLLTCFLSLAVAAGLSAGRAGAQDAPPPRQFPEGWQLGTPDLVLTPQSEFTLGPDGDDVFRCFVLPAKTLEDHYVTAVEIRPSNNRIVHHVLLFTDTKGRGRDLEARAAKNAATTSAEESEHGRVNVDKGPGYSVTMGVGFQPDTGLRGWAPGSAFATYAGVSSEGFAAPAALTASEQPVAASVRAAKPPSVNRVRIVLSPSRGCRVRGGSRSASDRADGTVSARRPQVQRPIAHVTP